MKILPPWRPSRRQILIAGGLAASGLSAHAMYDPARATNMKTAQRAGIAFGTTVSLKAACTDTALLDNALDAAWRELLAVEAAATLFRPDSPICQLTKMGVLETPPELLVQMLTEALNIARLTDGAFDPTVQPLWRLYADAYAAGRYATEAEIFAASEMIGW